MLGHIFLTAIEAVAPIVALIAIGYILKRSGILNDNFVQVGQRLVFIILLPAMLFVNVYEISGLDAIAWDMVLYCVAMVFGLFALGFVVAKHTTKDLRRRGVLWQCAFRSNFSIIGLPLAQALSGSEGAAMAAVLAAFAVPAFNVLGILALSAYVDRNGREKRTVGQYLHDIFTNPLIVGVLLGISALLIRSLQTAIFGEVVFSLKRDLNFVFQILTELKAVASPLALIVLGGQCEFSAIGGMRKEIVVGVLCRIVFAPALAIGGAALLSHCTPLLSCGNAEYGALIGLFGSPVAAASAIMAAAMGNDDQLAAQLIVWTSVFSAFTIFIAVSLLMANGLLVI